MKKRIIGIDVARALAVIGMIIVNFKVVFGTDGNYWLKTFAHIFDGKAAATFVVLAGVGLALMTNSAVKKQDWIKLKTARKKIIKRAGFLFVIGMSYMWIWPADILHYYGIYMLISLLFISQTNKHIIIAILSFVLCYPLLIAMFDYETGWDFATLTYTDFWQIDGFFRNLLFNGFHPVVPWTAFMLFGLWFGKQDLYNNKYLKKSLWLGVITFILVQGVSILSIAWIAQGEPTAIAQLKPVLGTDPMPPMPLYMLNGIAVSVIIIAACILLARKYESSILIVFLRKTGQLALSFYVAHVVIGMGLVETISSVEFGEYSIEFSVVYAMFFSLCCVIFAQIWLHFYRHGPLEWIMRKLSS